MNRVYKVTAAELKQTKTGKDVFALELNGAFWATRLVPPPKGLYGAANRDNLYFKFSKIGTLEFVIGKYIALEIEQTKFGANFTKVLSYDVIESFEYDLKQCHSTAFRTPVNIYDFLTERGYELDEGDRIILKHPYSDRVVKKDGDGAICLPAFMDKTEVLTYENIDLIYRRFFEGQDHCEDVDRSEQYSVTPVGIQCYFQKYGRDHSGVINSGSHMTMPIGSRLTDEHRDYLAQVWFRPN